MSDREWWEQTGDAIVAGTCEQHGHQINEHGVCDFCDQRPDSSKNDALTENEREAVRLIRLASSIDDAYTLFAFARTAWARPLWALANDLGCMCIAEKTCPACRLRAALRRAS